MNRISNEKFYYSAIAEHGLTAEGLRWHSYRSQEIRFHQIMSLLPSDTVSLVDAGCGFGDLYLYICEHRKEPVSYVGLDSLELMVIETRERTGQPVFQCDILRGSLVKGEFYVCSGALNLLTQKDAYRFIERCYTISDRGIIFNFLEGEKQASVYNYFQLFQIENLAEKLGARLKFRRGYYEHDCTAAVYK